MKEASLTRAEGVRGRVVRNEKGMYVLVTTWANPQNSFLIWPCCNLAAQYIISFTAKIVNKTNIGKMLKFSFSRAEDWGSKMFSYLLKVTEFVNGKARTQIRSYDCRPTAVSTSHSVTFPSYVTLKNNRVTDLLSESLQENTL